MLVPEQATYVIASCDLFSDLWENHLHFLRLHFPEMERIVIVTDTNEKNRSFEGVAIREFGKEISYSERLAKAMTDIETDYVLFTLDDYFLKKRVIIEKLEEDFSFVEENADYMRLFLQPKPKRKDRQGSFYSLDYNRNYSVNLYPGIWRKEVLRSVCEGTPRTPWELEVSLNRRFQKNGFKGVASLGEEFPIMDMVRKGKYLRKAYRWLKKQGRLPADNQRKKQTIRYEFALNLRTFISRHFPKPFVNWLKKVFRYRAYSDYREEEA